MDTDGDGVGNNKDVDDDNDGLVDGKDPFPLVGRMPPHEQLRQLLWTTVTGLRARVSDPGITLCRAKAQH